MDKALQDLLTLLELEPLEENIFRGQSRDIGTPQVFGGQVLGQALAAASRTVHGRGVHSLHAYFLQRGDVRRPSSTRSTVPATAAASPTGGSLRFSTGRRFSTWPRRSRCRRPDSSIRRRCRRCRGPTVCRIVEELARDRGADLPKRCSDS